MTKPSSYATFFYTSSPRFIALVSSCSCYTRQNGKSDQQEEITRLNSTIDCLQEKISELEEQNFNQESRIKDLEDDLESVITFLNNELDY